MSAAATSLAEEVASLYERWCSADVGEQHDADICCSSTSRESEILKSKQRPPQKYVLAARFIRQMLPLISVEENAYGSKPKMYLEIDSTRCKSRTVCSSFLTELFLASYLWKTNVEKEFIIRQMTGRFAKDYFQCIFEERGYQRIMAIPEAKEGDILAVDYAKKKEEGEKKKKKKGDTGHVMLFLSAAQQCKQSDDGTTEWLVEVMDSVRTYHGPHDTRAPPHTPGGIGIGHIRLVTNNSHNIIIGYAWSSTGKYYPCTERMVVIGRPSILPDCNHPNDSRGNVKKLGSGSRRRSMVISSSAPQQATTCVQRDPKGKARFPQIRVVSQPTQLTVF